MMLTIHIKVVIIMNALIVLLFLVLLLLRLHAICLMASIGNPFKSPLVQMI